MLSHLKSCPSLSFGQTSLWYIFQKWEQGGAIWNFFWKCILFGRVRRPLNVCHYNWTSKVGVTQMKRFNSKCICHGPSHSWKLFWPIFKTVPPPPIELGSPVNHLAALSQLHESATCHLHQLHLNALTTWYQHVETGWKMQHFCWIFLQLVKEEIKMSGTGPKLNLWDRNLNTKAVAAEFWWKL